jgi:hypothetical protein
VDQNEESVKVKVSLIYIYEKHQGIECCSNSNRAFKDTMDSFSCVSSTPHARSVQCSLRQTFTVMITAVPLTSLRDSSTQYGVRSTNGQFLNKSNQSKILTFRTQNDAPKKSTTMKNMTEQEP